MKIVKSNMILHESGGEEGKNQQIEWNDLPPELHFDILKKMDSRDLIRMEGVNREFQVSLFESIYDNNNNNNNNRNNFLNFPQFSSNKERTIHF